jgi:ATP-dependent helicase/nuclease subunit A
MGAKRYPGAGLGDRDARLKITAGLDRTFLVEAGAGSGKTKSLIDRMIALIAGGKCRIETLAAVTFTRKAAAELRGRFQTELERAAAVKETHLETRERLGVALRNLERCFTGTIHSFCARLIRERPVESGIDPEFVEMEELDDAVFREERWRDYLAKVRLEDEGGVLKGLDDVGLVPEDLENAFASLALYPEVGIKPGSEAPPDFKKLRKRLEGFLGGARKAIPSEAGPNGFDKLQGLMRRCFLRERNLGFDDPRVLMETCEVLHGGGGITQKCWRSKDEAKAFAEAFEVFRTDIVVPGIREWREFRYGKALTLLRPALEFLAGARRKESRLNFQDQLMLAALLLRDNPEVRSYFAKRYTHILVDEFQDTDPVQAEVLLYLAGEDREERDWRKVKPRPGGLFLVGDPKQSIFRFRRADIDTYNMVKERIEASGGEVLYLTANFRSLKPLADWVNPLFKGAFPSNGDRYQAGFAPIETMREGVDRAWEGLYKITIPRVARNSQHPIAAYDAGVIADWIAWACAGNVRLARTDEEKRRGVDEKARPEDFLILFRYKKNMSDYARAFEKMGIPFEITGSDAFAKSGEVQEILNLVHALRDPENSVDTVAVLRGTFFGLSDDELYRFRKRGGRFSMLVADPAGVEGTALPRGRVADALRKMREWWAWTRRLPISAALERVFEDSGILPYMAASEMASSKAGNIALLLDMLRAEEASGRSSFAEITAFLGKAVDETEIEEMSLTPGRTDAVRLMNLHKAKGLEAPVVFLANPVGVKEHEADRHITRTGDAPEGFFVLRKKKGPYRFEMLAQPLGWEAAGEEEGLYAQAEEMRLMYVAATRAKNLMIVSTYGGELSAKEAWRTLDERLGGVPELERAPEAAAARKIKVDVTEEERERGAEEISKRKAAARAEGYGRIAVTSLAKNDENRPERDLRGQGMGWGRAVHRVLEALGKGTLVRGESGETRKRFDLAVENVLAAEDIGLEEKPLFVALVDSIVGSEFWARVLRAEKKLFEVPFAIRMDGPGAPAVPTVLSGAIDLVFLEKGGWVIVDYKTDIVTERLEEFVEYYRPQVKVYCRFWEEATGGPVKEAVLYFVRGGQALTLDKIVPSQDLAAGSPRKLR